MAVALGTLAALAPGSRPATVVAVVLWGAAFAAVPACIQSRVLQAAPEAAEIASALLVVAFQIGIGGGALVGSLLVGSGHLADLPLLGALLAGGATALAGFGRSQRAGAPTGRARSPRTVPAR